MGWRPHIGPASPESLLRHGYLWAEQPSEPPQWKREWDHSQAQRSGYLLFIYSSVKHAHIISQALCEDMALNMASMVSARMGLNIQQGTQAPSAIPTNVMSTTQEDPGV